MLGRFLRPADRNVGGTADKNVCATAYGNAYDDAGDTAGRRVDLDLRFSGLGVALGSWKTNTRL